MTGLQMDAERAVTALLFLAKYILSNGGCFYPQVTHTRLLEMDFDSILSCSPSWEYPTKYFKQNDEIENSPESFKPFRAEFSHSN
jgi:hypothetical protein